MSPDITPDTTVETSENQLIDPATFEIKFVESGNILIKGIDAYEGTPIIDLQPYTPGNYWVASTEVPVWVYRYGK
jgi:tRNA (Thr-GGU) A37 N-methylase